MIFDEKIYQFMYAALQEAELAFEENEVPIGAVVVHNNKIIGRGHNQTELLKDSTAHAEMLAITAAANHLDSKYLSECDLYVSVEPCIMCSGAIILSRLKSIYFGANEPKFGSAGSVYNFFAENRYNYSVKVYGGIYENESKHLIQEFFRNKRKRDDE